MAKTPGSESVMDMFARLGEQMKLPSVDVQSILDHHRKNLEALEKSAKAGASGASEMMSKQRDILERSLTEMRDMAQSFTASGNPQDLMAKQADFVRRSFESAVKNAGEVAQIAQKSGAESIEILRNRIRESMDEIRAGYDKRR